MQRLDIIVDEIPVIRDHYGVQPHARFGYGIRHVAPEHLVLSGYSPGIQALGKMVRVMVQGLGGGDPETALELLVADEAGVGTECIDLRDIPPEKDFKVAHTDERGRVRHDTRKESPVLLVAAQLGLSVCQTCDGHGLEREGVPHHRQQGPEAELPPAVPHRGGNPYAERQVDHAQTLCDIGETGADDGRVYHVARHHLPVFVPDRLHQVNLTAVLAGHGKGVPGYLRVVQHGKDGLVRPAEQVGSHLGGMEPGYFFLGGAADGTAEHYRQDKEDATLFHSAIQFAAKLCSGSLISNRQRGLGCRFLCF